VVALAKTLDPEHAATLAQVDAHEVAALSREVERLRGALEHVRVYVPATVMADFLRLCGWTIRPPSVRDAAPAECPKCRGSGLGRYGVDEGAGDDTCTDCNGEGRSVRDAGDAGLQNPLGANIAEWPEGLRVRELPDIG
jgi:hypothetical protein